jgi:peptidoglycan hydrolase-like protein with peptidoglycan-binding domain
MAGLALGVSTGLAAMLGAGVLVGTTSATAVVRAGGPVHATAVPTPTVPSGLPTGIEALAGYVKQVSCDPTPKPGAVALGRLLAATYPGTSYLIGHGCGSEPIASEHQDGRAIDWMVSARSATQKAQAQAFLGWLFDTDDTGRAFAQARRLGVMYVIWADRIWGAWSPMEGWSPYSTCATHPEAAADTVCHRDRMLISLSWNGAMARTSFFSRTVAAADYGPCRPKDLNWAPAYTTANRTPCPDYPAVTAPSGAAPTLLDLVRFSGATVGPGDNGPVVAAVQRALNLPADGAYGPFTADAVVTFQRQHGLPPSGAMDAGTWRALLAARAVTIPTDATKITGGTTSPLRKYAATVLRYGDRGPAVLALQKALKVTCSGWFGPKTRVAVVNFQVKAKLPTTGIVSAATWKALGA